MTRKKARSSISAVRRPRPLVPSSTRATSIPAAATIAALLVGCGKREAPPPPVADRTTSPSASASSAPSESVAAISASTSASTVVAASCSASVHVFPHVVAAPNPSGIAGIGAIGPMKNPPMVNGGLAVVQPNVVAPTAAVTEASTSVNGGLSKADVEKVVHGRFGRFRLCYQQGLAQDPSMQGVVSTTFTIAPNGDVTTATTSSSLGNTNVDFCVKAAFRVLLFPKADAPTTVVYPLAFHSASSI